MGKKRAVLVGLTSVDPEKYDGWDGESGCAGCAKDVNRVRELLKARGFDAPVVLLTERATHRAVLDALCNEAEDAEPGDLLVFYYSGHGGQMPDEDGYMLARRVKQDPHLRGLPFVMLTSIGTRDDAARLRRRGISAALTKPVKHSDLLDTFASLFAVVGRREAELAAAVKSLGDRASFATHDVREVGAAASLVDRVTCEAGPITCLVNNAGINLKKPAIETTPEEFENMLRTHVVGAHALVRTVAPGMIERRHGSILFTASMASLFGIPLVIERVGEPAFDELLRKAYEGGSGEAGQIVEGIEGETDLAGLAEGLPEPSDLMESEDDAPVIRLINAVLSQAIKENASDIHIEPYENRLVIRFRVDGVLR